MSVPTPSNPNSDYADSPLPAGYGGMGAPARPPFSKRAIAGFVLACVSVFYLGAMGSLGAILCINSLTEIRGGRARGRGLAIAGIVVGLVSFILYGINFFVRRMVS